LWSITGSSDAYLSDPAAIELVDSMTRTSPRFEALWHAQAVRRTDTDILKVDHPQGRLALTLVHLQGSPHQESASTRTCRPTRRPPND
jgi:hypothetical protein